MFEFAGRRADMELQRPFIDRILAEHPQVEFHIWNLARNRDDAEYIKDADGNHQRITVFNHLYGEDCWRRFNDVYHHYAHPDFRDCLFVKVDDDVVFIETGRFGEFLAAVDGNRKLIVSANVINNGACTRVEPSLWEGLAGLEINLLDVHLSTAYALMCHEFFFDHHDELLGQPVWLLRTMEWLSINLIGFDHPMMCEIARRVGRHSPPIIAGRRLRGIPLGDEGMVNTLPRAILGGFLACHLYFGPQAAELSVETLSRLRKKYAEIGDEYLAG